MAEKLTFAVVSGAGHVVMTVAGECDARTSDQFRAALEPVITRETNLVIMDFSGLAFLDSSGVHALIDAHAAVTAAGSVLVLACARPIVARILTLTGADQLIRVTATVEEAMNVRDKGAG